MKKPASCAGCPFAAMNPGSFVPDEIVEGAPVAIMAMAPHTEEVAQGKPMVGATGQEQERCYFPRAGLQRGEVSIMNALRCQVTVKLDEFPKLERTETRAALEHCHRAHFHMPSGVKLFVAQGEYALWRLTGESGTDEGHGRGILGWRGWVLPYNPSHADLAEFTRVWTPDHTDLKVLATVHIAAVLRDPTLQPSAYRDWAKVPLILAGKWPERFPDLQPLPPLTWPVHASGFDTEFGRDRHKTLIRYSLAWRGDHPYVYVVEAKDFKPLIQGGSSVRVFMQNAPADLDTLDLLLPNAKNLRVDDTMYQHAVLWAGLDHDLNTLGSWYARTNRWKHLDRVNPREYAGGDALGTYDAGVAMLGELERDPRSKWVYENLQLPLLPLMRRNEERGLRIHQGHAHQAAETLGARVKTAELKAAAAAGWPLNPGSAAQVSHWLFEYERVTEKLRAKR